MEQYDKLTPLQIVIGAAFIALVIFLWAMCPNGLP